jgi:hypothetical protein
MAEPKTPSIEVLQALRPSDARVLGDEKRRLLERADQPGRKRFLNDANTRSAVADVQIASPNSGRPSRDESDQRRKSGIGKYARGENGDLSAHPRAEQR